MNSKTLKGGDTLERFVPAAEDLGFGSKSSIYPIDTFSIKGFDILPILFSN